jgi:gliding motility-associated-like protein
MTSNLSGVTGNPATSNELAITVNQPTTPIFSPFPVIYLGTDAPLLPATSNNGITGSWNPSVINTAFVGITTYTFTPDAGQCATSAAMDITISGSITPVFGAIGPLCQNSAAPALPATSTNGITGSWSPAAISTATAGTTTYMFIPDGGQGAIGTTMDILVTGSLTPTFGAIGPLCQNSLAPILPTSSANTPAITGVWSPATISTTTVGTRTYTFTPGAGQCATGTTLRITTNGRTAPSFTAIGPLCQNSAAPALPLTSANGITGTWSPATISTATAGTTTYTFTPASGVCATAATMSITVTAEVTPHLLAIGPLCQNSTAPALPYYSADFPAITGTWSPATISTATIGTRIYTFTPAAGQCARTVTLAITTVSLVTPAFTQTGPLCRNSTAPALSSTSTNGISGTWSPATISTAVVATTAYTFTPAAGQCAATTAMDITVSSQITPAFTQIGPLCQNSAPPALPATSTNGIAGTWSPATISTAVVATTTYTFTPAAGQCAATTAMDITVSSQITPAFVQIGPLCQNSTAPALPSTSTNGISGTWSPATISTAAVATTTYTFTPDAGQCSTTATMNITITPQITPAFAAIGPLCQNSAAPTLPTGSANTPSISGTWSPAVVTTTNAGTTTYTFTPASGQCALTATMDIVVLPAKTSTTVVTVCSTRLPYTWNSQTISVAGTYQAVLVSSNGCDSIAALNLAVNEAVNPIFTRIAPILQGSVAPALADTSSNGITGNWNPDTISTINAGTTTYTFTPDSGLCATSVTMDITIQLDAIIAGPSLTGVCEGATLNASKSVGDIVKYEWSLIGQGGTLDSTTGVNSTFKLSPTYTGLLPANFRVKLQVTSRNGLTSSDTITITVDHPPVANVYSSGSLEKDGSMIVDGSVSTGTDLSYLWSTAQGKILGPNNQPTVKLFGSGIYTLEISDSHGCTDSKTFQYPMAFHSITANPDYARIAWDQDTTINVLANDHSTVYLRPSTVTVTDPASRGVTKVNADGSITYIPQGKNTGSDTFVYEVCDTLDFCASAKVTIEIYDSGVKIPEGFSPNGDGENDFMVFPDLLQNHPNSQLYVFTRSGQLVYQSLNYQNDWDGRMANHQLVPTGTYYFVLQITTPYSRTIKSFIFIGY